VALYYQSALKSILREKILLKEDPAKRKSKVLRGLAARKGREETKAGGIIWHDLRRTFATRLRANRVHEYDIQDLLGHAKPGFTKVYARATLTVLEDAVNKLTEPWGEVIKFERKAS